MAWALAIDVDAKIAPTITIERKSRIIVSFWAHALCTPHLNLVCCIASH
jgi:hypothetical protein